mmetsp:Transcript_19112/g.32819  ORF Transcript_19112/g.32819 Transcript_19112/m.32819 type:complete len:343 (+) Transcript_19112:208-1236(+)
MQQHGAADLHSQRQVAASTSRAGSAQPHAVNPLPLGLARVNLTVVMCVLLFLFLYSVDVLLIIVPWLNYSVPGATNMCILTASTVFGLHCYFFCVLLDPGGVPDDWVPDPEQAALEVKKKGGARICQKCQRAKPPRTHHCRVCKRCITRMDHHCPWTNNCIGHGNYRAFLLCLLYVGAALVHTVGLIVAHVLHTLETSQDQRVLRTGPQGTAVQLHPQGEAVQLQDSWLGSLWLWALLETIAFMIALPLAVGIILLLAWHVHLIITNKTTIEYQEGVNASEAAFDGKFTYVHPYDVGLLNNSHEILGHDLTTWCAPPCAPTPGGLYYPTVWDEPVEGVRKRG